MKQYSNYLSRQFASMFGAGIRSRGHDYFATGAVQIDEADDKHVLATVNGARDYHVDLP